MLDAEDAQNVRGSHIQSLVLAFYGELEILTATIDLKSEQNY